jgi:hypothetical protein
MMAISSIPAGATHPIINHYPVPKVREPDGAEDYWFPIGWAMFLYDYDQNRPSSGEDSKTTVTATFDDDWTEGWIDTIETEPWNCIFGLCRPGGDPSIRTINSDDYTYCLEAVDNATHTLKLIPLWLDKRYSSTNDVWALPAGINWGTLMNDVTDQHLRDSDSYLATMISDVYSSQHVSQLGGWFLADEPYCGEGFWNNTETELSYDYDTPPPSGPDTWYWIDSNNNYRDLTQEGSPCPYSGDDSLSHIGDDTFHRLKYINTRYLWEWNKDGNGNDISEVPIFAVVRHAAGYGKVDTQAHNLHCRISDVLCDDNYLFNDAASQAVDPNNRWKLMTEDAVDNLLASTVTPKPKAYIMFLDGMSYPIPLGGGLYDPWIPDEDDVRYAAYTSLVHGARGINFWNLSRSQEDAFDCATQVAQDVKEMVPFLLTEHPFAQDEIYMTSSTGNTNGLSFLVRINPNDSTEALIIVCNDSADNIVDVWIHFPGSFDVDYAEPIRNVHNWYTYVYQLENKVEIESMDSWTGKAFIVHKEQ